MDAVHKTGPTTKGSTISWLLQEDYEGERGPKSIILPFGLHGGLLPHQQRFVGDLRLQIGKRS